MFKQSSKLYYTQSDFEKEFNSTERLVPIWYTGNPLPTDEEYDEHILEHVLAKYKNVETDQLNSDLEDVSYDSESDTRFFGPPSFRSDGSYRITSVS